MRIIKDIHINMYKGIYKGTFIILLSTILITNYFFSSTVYADDNNEEEVDNVIQEFFVEQPTIESSTREYKNPIINSRRYTIYDRKSGLSIYGKDETKQSAMASTTNLITT